MQASMGEWHGPITWELTDLDREEDRHFEGHTICLKFKRGNNSITLFFENPTRARAFVKDIIQQADVLELFERE